jgi:S-formylglutathione hydrolase FrmB
MNERGGRAIAGLSMGGYGAFKFAVKYPEMFAFAGSLSGAFGAATWTSETLNGSTLVLNSLAPVFGSANSRNRAENDLLRLIDELPAEGVKKLPFLYLDCGAEDIFLPINRTLESKLLEKNIPHEFRILPGGHNWNYWDQQAREILRLASTHVTPPKIVR